MKKADTQKEEKFIEHYAMTGNAKESAIKSGYKESSATSMGYYLKQKLAIPIQQKQTERINSISGIAISTLEQLLNSEQDSVKLNTAKLILELGGYNKQNINLNIESKEQKSDEELIAELHELMKDMKLN
jgi:phage terminase small subunit